MPKIVSRESYKNGQVIFKEGSFGEGTYLILSGKVRISKRVGSDEVTIAVLGQDDVFGEISFIDRESRSASAIAEGDVQVGLLDKDFLDQEINKTSLDFQRILRTLTERLRKTTGELINIKTEYHNLKKQ